MRWWGWGEDGGGHPLPEAAVALLESELGIGRGDAASRVEIDQVELHAGRLPDSVRALLAGIVGEDAVRDDREARVLHAAGRSYPDLLRLRSGRDLAPPDAVVMPSSQAQVAAVLELCAGESVAVVPFGGGTSVVGGVDGLCGPHRAAISLDLRRLRRVVGIDRVSLTATLEAGLLGPEVEDRLGAAGLTLGHFPQSFEYSTLGGWVATRSAGQASTGYGRIDELVEGLRLCTPVGELVCAPVPASAAGPSLCDLAVGSEGTLGVICEATVRVRPAPEQRLYEAWALPTFADGAAALRALEQSGLAPDVARLSDEDETRLTMALGSSGGIADHLAAAYLKVRRRSGGCLAFTGFDGTRESVADRRWRAADVLRSFGAVSLGRRPGRSWLRGRFAAPYLRDELLDRGVMVETLETATEWSNLDRLYEGVRAALSGSLADRGTPPAVMCHVSHLYRSGASLYFTFLARQEVGAELDQWRAAKHAACDAIVSCGGTITHHHAVGADHRQWMPAEVGPVGLAALRAVKERLDPAGIMNPGKLLPDP